MKTIVHGAVLFALTIPSGIRAEIGSLQERLDSIAQTAGGRLGVCVLRDSDTSPVCLRGNEPFPLQSVMKLIVGAALLDAVDRGDLTLEQRISVTTADVSPGPREFANQIRKQASYEATLEELLRRSIIDSDSTSVDILISRLGGVGAIQAFLKRKGLTGIRIDRSEKELQTESVGLLWRREFADLDVYEAAISAIPEARREKSWESHLKDPRDKASPVAVALFLRTLMSGKLLSGPSTEKLISIMIDTATGRDRLRAGVDAGWKVAHKTGTGRSWKGVTETTNDVGILISPEGKQIIVAVFLAESHSSDAQQATIIAHVASAAAGFALK